MPTNTNLKKEKVQTFLEVTSALMPNSKLKTANRKLYNLYIHDERFSKQEVIINQEYFPNVKSGDLLEIFHPESQSSSNTNWQSNNTNSNYIKNQKHKHSIIELINSLPANARRLIVQVNNIDKDIGIRQPQLQVK